MCFCNDNDDSITDDNNSNVRSVSDGDSFCVDSKVNGGGVNGGGDDNPDDKGDGVMPAVMLVPMTMVIVIIVIMMMVTVIHAPDACREFLS